MITRLYSRRAIVRCAKHAPRSLDDALSSLEAYGIHVAKIGDVSGLRYINGKDTVTYFSGEFVPIYRMIVCAAALPTLNCREGIW